ncbi:hypothetical protein KKG41_00790 [Patescibacteria group bacterium]|nr:hypothetical protein [Patescibacteria group bacterium]MBU1891011.1 hypothetical protein [Patescibacteria group bacterium]
MIIQLSSISEAKDNISAAGRSRAETAATLLQELPEDMNTDRLEFRRRVVHECRQGISTVQPVNETDESLIERAKKILEELEQAKA